MHSPRRPITNQNSFSIHTEILPKNQLIIIGISNVPHANIGLMDIPFPSPSNILLETNHTNLTDNDLQDLNLDASPILEFNNLQVTKKSIINPVYTQKELSFFPPEHRLSMSNTRRNSIAHDLFGHPVHFESNWQNSKETLTKVTIPANPPDDEALIELLEANRQYHHEASLAQKRHNKMGSEDEKEEMIYDLAIKTLKGETNRPDLLIIMLEKEVDKLNTYQKDAMGVANHNPDAPNKNNVKIINASVVYAQNTVDSVKARFPQKIRFY